MYIVGHGRLVAPRRSCLLPLNQSAFVCAGKLSLSLSGYIEPFVSECECVYVFVCGAVALSS